MQIQTIYQLNTIAGKDFIHALSGVYEHSPWVAEIAETLRPFPNFASLREAMANVVAEAPFQQKLKLINAHPDLAGRLAQQGQLTPESAREQASAGLAQANPEIIRKIQILNAQYQSRFHFPFIICARLNNVQTILTAMENRLSNSLQQEITTALAEIDKIAGLRLLDLIEE